ncbi:MAG TPA: PEP/pyruvate-binding domain-containing protein [Syntrophales bacterium]|nr:PEP/pyruvate-binding domain-containing protein [Syntrophales bacterium]HON22393.1 PEP/pyruvate-binding domain-containing protein [Syntrophales bacterium]HOU77943.1 PEP/pyruvate-binding domain-containing protein [Syntrophales bacterium]HPC33214.1 PEP/pyruvate-binding domain-containing protein [Syntrophales bacterium]HQG34567.1 PEP/pyruvate-binding domain-containing protein [Syntrophales bacterium]
MVSFSRVSSGIKGLDEVLNFLQTGDNVVLQVDGIEDYRHFVLPFVDEALKNNERVVYVRFARHAPLLDAGRVTVYKLNADTGFESFSSQVHNIIRQEGRDVFYVFDCLSDLLLAWATDLMIGNFFVITCPYLFELNTVAYFAILRGRHSFKTVARIRETTQVLLDVYNYQGKICVHPLKAWHRYSPTMFLPHITEGEKYLPIINSVDATQLFSFLAHKSAVNAERHLDYWDRIFLRAQEILADPEATAARQEMVDQLSRVLIGRERRMLALARDYFTLEDLLEIKNRLIGTGFIGGKSVGMLLARNILRRDQGFDWPRHLELHDSFYIGSDVFYSYIVQNGWWKLLMAQKTKEGYFAGARELQARMLRGVFPEEVREQFQLMLEYFGQSPIIVRSSSLLEDAFGNAFAGKYESFFCVNQGTPEQRYEALEEAVRRIFASTMNEDALTYRLQRGLDQQDEQMALLVQRVSGTYRKHYFFPEVAGVGLSYNTFVWKQGMDPRAGMLRIVFGLGTRAVNRVENDYPRIVALDAPLVKPHGGMADIRRFSQHDVDVLNLTDNRFHSLSLVQVVNEELDNRLDLIGVRDTEAAERLRATGRSAADPWVLTFDEFLTATPFTEIMSRMLKTLEEVYQYPVDIEFTANFNAEGGLQVNLLQCRPFQTKGQHIRVEIPAKIKKQRILLRQEGNFMGGSVSQPLARIIYVDPQGYTRLSLSEKYDVARLVGRLNKLIEDREGTPTALLGPGRWGTTTPAMGVPVTFSEINNITAIAEIAYQDGSLIPDLSFGTHFFQDLVEMDIFYMAIYPDKQGVLFNREWLAGMPNRLAELAPRDRQYAETVRVYDVRERGLILMSDVVTQQLICFGK